ncbi:MAG: PIN domain-containing protein [Proteobacteria bacterium]|nr:PIN domain-containing protein [Pseudomonadota bacterium]
MIALDTNVLLRALVDDDKAVTQCAAARRLVAAAGVVAICAAVFLETVWTLSRSFGFSRKEVVRVASMLLRHPKYRIQDSDLFAAALARFADGNIDFADAVALEQAVRGNAVLHTFDRKLAKLAGAQFVQ